MSGNVTTLVATLFFKPGPGEITVFHPEAYEAMDGLQNRNTRSDWYDLLYPRISSIFTRDKKLHNERRKMWEQALSTKALQQYHRRVIEKVHTLEDLVAMEESNPVLVNDLMYFFAFDSMGDFAFSEDFGMMRTRKWHSSIVILRSALTMLGPFSPAIWIPRLGFAFIPGLWKKVLSDRDIASWFIEDYKKHGSDPTRTRWLSGDTATLVVAGSDTTAPSLTLLFYFLARYPDHAEKIHEELQEVNIEDPALLSTLPHLNGMINEAMRLLPAVLTFSSRVSPPEGLIIHGTFIPGNTKVCAPRYTIGRLETAYVNPHDFIPERWYSRPELIKDKRAFAPFGIGKLLRRIGG
ncbi:Cytochrome P450 [Penicillium canescens]|uniref:Cytochrome P450 n=1 Tax=Penicillium canescens TaxID=5083 RepID=A0AAD6I2Q5_PENCN|nr:Cytochrome P450 [Penicillium canescens]KAJ6041002.1 Cytochrome P450 [Penicillium canescens]